MLGGFQGCVIVFTWISVLCGMFTNSNDVIEIMLANLKDVIQL